MNEKNIKALLKGIGIPDAALTEIEKDDFNPADTITKFHESQKTHYHDIISNEITPEIESRVTAEVEKKRDGVFRNDIKKHLGVPLEKIKDLPAHEALKVAKQMWDETYSKNPGADVIQQLQTENLKLQNTLADYETSKKTEIDNIRKEESNKTINKLGEIEITKSYREVAAERIVGKKHTDGIHRAVKSDIYENYYFAPDENGNPVPINKSTGKRATLKDATGKEYFAKVSELVLSSLESQEFINKSNGGEGSGQEGQGSAGNGQKQKSARLLEMEAEIAKNQQLG